MENYEYEREFPLPEEFEDDIDPSTQNFVIEFLQKYNQSLKDSTHIIRPYAPMLFSRTIANCELIAKEFSGKIKATIDYSDFPASIKVWCLYAEFQRGEFMAILHKLSVFAESVRFTPLRTGDLLIEIEMPYFIRLNRSE